jgi:2-methylcitrate dehydratase PrpD
VRHRRRAGRVLRRLCHGPRERGSAARLTEQLGESWAILDGYTKIYACCQHLHAAVEAALELRKVLTEEALQDIASITVETHALALPLVNPEPHTTLAAKFSMSHAIAAALALGSGGAEAFATATLGDARLAQLRPRVKVRPWATYRRRPTIARRASS